MAAPPAAREGEIAQSVQRPLVAGVAPFLRALSPRTTTYDLWTPLRLLGTNVGIARLERIHGTKLQDPAAQRLRAYLDQAETYYLSAETMAPESRPLLGYYFMLNLAKALLTALDPSLTERRGVHGLGDAFDRKQRYWFIHERAKVSTVGAASTNVFRELARRTGKHFAYAPNYLLEIQKLAPYLAETAEVFQDAVAEPPRLVPAQSVEVWSNGDELWLRLEVDRGELRRRGLGPESLVTQAAIFGSKFRLVQSRAVTASYESLQSFKYGRRTLDQFSEIAQVFEQSLIHVNRGATGSRYQIVISQRTDLLSQEAVSFAVMHHLSNMVRYRPEQVTKLAAQKWFFLLETWVPRAMENFLLALASRLTYEEIRIV